MRQYIPYSRFRCVLFYNTPGGHEKQISYIVPARAADIAVERAERILRADKRRRIRCVTYSEAVEL